jgi:HEPN domain-containing protein
MKKLTRGWVRKAEADYRVAVKVGRGAEALHDAVCFHCQQSAEKYLKGLMEQLGLEVPKTHDLDQLRTTLEPHHPELKPLGRGLTFLTRFAVDIRYPGESASKREAVAARWLNGCGLRHGRFSDSAARPRRKK